MRRVPVRVAAPVVYEGFKRLRPELLGGLTREEYLDFFCQEYSDIWNDGSAWVLCRTKALDHCAEVHVYSFDRRFSDKLEFFREVLEELRTAGKHRVWTILWPSAGHSVLRTLRELGFQAEGILRDYYQFGPPGEYQDASIWAILLDEGERKNELEN